MGYDYITTLRPDEGKECEFPKLLKNWLRLNFGVECPEDFGIQGSIQIPHSDEYLCLFASVDSKDFGYLLVLEGKKQKGWRTNYFIYGALQAYCNRCHFFQDKAHRFCPKCGEKLQYQF